MRRAVPGRLDYGLKPTPEPAKRSADTPVTTSLR